MSAEQRYRFLVGAGRELAATLDYEETLADVAGRPLPFLGAWCIVDVLEDDGRLRRVAIVHPDPDMRQLVEELRAGWPPSRDDPFGVPTVAATGEPEICRSVTPSFLADVAQDEDNLRILRELRMGSLISVPMCVRGKVTGAITYVTPEAGHTFDDDDVAMATDLAALSALAVDNARLHEQARAAIEEAQARRLEAERLAALVGSINERLLVSAVQELERADSAEAAEMARSEHTMSLSHELRTPLSAIVGYAELLQAGMQGPVTAKQATSLARIRQAAGQVLRLIDQILTSARIDAGREPLRVEPVDLTALAREALALLEPLAAKKRLEFGGDFPAEPLMLPTDPDKVRQILLNLLANAIKFTRRGSVRLEAQAQPEGVRFRVIDTGPGISREDRARIFERFQQAEDVAADTTAGGSGLGLAITRALVNLLDGDMDVETELGRGTIFTVTLPSLERRAPVEDEAEPSEDSA